MKRLSLLQIKPFEVFLFSLLLVFLNYAPDHIYATEPWTVFSSPEITSPNLLVNPGFEEGPEDSANGWNPYESGYKIDKDGGRDGGRALKLINEKGERHGLFRLSNLTKQSLAHYISAVGARLRISQGI